MLAIGSGVNRNTRLNSRASAPTPWAGAGARIHLNHDDIFVGASYS